MQRRNDERRHSKYEADEPNPRETCTRKQAKDRLFLLLENIRDGTRNTILNLALTFHDPI